MGGQGGNLRTRWWTRLWWWTKQWWWTMPRWWTTPSRWTTQYLYNWQLCHRVDWQTKIWPNGENTQKNCLSFHVSFVFLLLMLLLDGKQFNKYLYFGRSLYCFILTFYNIEAVEDFLGASQTEVKNHLVSGSIWSPFFPWSITSKVMNGILVGAAFVRPYIKLWIAIKRNWKEKKSKQKFCYPMQCFSNIARDSKCEKKTLLTGSRR